MLNRTPRMLSHAGLPNDDRLMITVTSAVLPRARVESDVLAIERVKVDLLHLSHRNGVA
jgi:hypothetical protein